MIAVNPNIGSKSTGKKALVSRVDEQRSVGASLNPGNAFDDVNIASSDILIKGPTAHASTGNNEQAILINQVAQMGSSNQYITHPTEGSSLSHMEPFPFAQVSHTPRMHGARRLKPRDLIVGSSGWCMGFGTKVRIMEDGAGAWDVSLVRLIFPPSEVECILVFPIWDQSEEDWLIWHFDKRARFRFPNKSELWLIRLGLYYRIMKKGLRAHHLYQVFRDAVPRLLAHS
ncbi:hypothetical protein Salat_2504300 [Sesamum alatum]|uniref:Uncharacterized protein n=1 Tax=Sesamum alatum TaxID=300844 RepID=A0AAE1XSI9_9LAMI|nr:hypothetical protein Salat_2504300 [Sesamum alatum]